jgi:hypothetical protein
MSTNGLVYALSKIWCFDGYVGGSTFRLNHRRGCNEGGRGNVLQGAYFIQNALLKLNVSRRIWTENVKNLDHFIDTGIQPKSEDRRFGVKP